MGDGPQNKIAFVIQARMRSERLPGKILLPVPLNHGRPLLLWIVEELRKSTHKADIIVATSQNSENDVLESFCEDHGIKCFRGEEENVLSRFISIARKNEYATIVRLTADNPIVDIKILDDTISSHLLNNSDYTNTTALPLGMNFEIISAKALISSGQAAQSKAETEHVTLHLKNNERYLKMVYDPQIGQYLKDLRLTVDYPADLMVVSVVLSFYEEMADTTGLSLVESVYKEFPFIFQANDNNFQKRQFSSNEQELEYAKSLLHSLELKHSARILERNEKKNII